MEKVERRIKCGNGREIEKVKEFSYLGFKLQRNDDVKKHMRERIRKANIVIKEVWGIDERIFRDDFRSRMYIFDTSVASVLLYGSKIFG